MITKMKKITFLAYHKEYESFLNSLRELGVVHTVEKQQGAADNTELQDNIRLSSRLAATLKLLQNMCREKGMTVIIITHNQALAPMADRLIHIKNGQVARIESNENPTSIDEIEW